MDKDNLKIFFWLGPGPIPLAYVLERQKENAEFLRTEGNRIVIEESHRISKREALKNGADSI